MDEKSAAIRHITRILAPIGIHDLDSVAERLFLDHGLNAPNVHPAVLYRDAIETCKDPVGGDDDMGLGWHITSPRGLPHLLVDFDYEGFLIQMHVQLPDDLTVDTKLLQRAFEADTHDGQDFEVVFDYVQEQMFEEDRPAFWGFLQDDCLDAVRYQQDIERIYRLCNANHLLRTAAKSGQVEAVKAALELGADPNKPDLLGFTAMHFAVGDRHGHLIQPLIEGGADINSAGGAMGSTPLHMAARAGDAQTCLTLMAFGANASLLDDMGRTPMELARKGLDREQELAPDL